MKITGIIAEYNPFHKGHLHQMENCRKSPDDYIIAVMSGDFVQRGAPAVFNKYHRTETALLGGADLVLELPCIYATASAPLFAAAAVSILDSLHCVDSLSFGCENMDFDRMKRLSEFLSAPGSRYEQLVNEALCHGCSYPKARENALQYLFGPDILSVIQTPNNILALEYLIALKKRNSAITPDPVLREGCDYHSITARENQYPSATAVRCLIEEYGNSLKNRDDSHAFQTLEQLGKLLPEHCLQYLLQNHVLKNGMDVDDFSFPLHCRLLSEAPDGFSSYADVSDDLSAKIIKNLNAYRSFSQFCRILKSRDLTYTRISRALLHIVLGIKKELYPENKYPFTVPYARVLGFRKNSAELLSTVKKHSEIPVISKLADADRLLDAHGRKLLSRDILSSHLYTAAAVNRNDSSFISEYEQQIVIVS